MEFILSIGWLFWVAASVVVTALAFASVWEKPGLFVAILLVGGTALLFLTGHNLTDAWNFINAHPLEIIRYLAAYIGIGVLYACIRWYFYLRDLRANLADWRARNPNASVPLSDDKLAEFKRSISFYKTFPPRVGEHKSTIMSHMILWSFCWVELRPLTKLFTFVYSSIAGSLQRMSDRMFADLT